SSRSPCAARRAPRGPRPGPRSKAAARRAWPCPAGDRRRRRRPGGADRAADHGNSSSLLLVLATPSLYRHRSENHRGRGRGPLERDVITWRILTAPTSNLIRIAVGQVAPENKTNPRSRVISID